MHGGLAAQEMVVEQKVATHACVDSLQGVSPVKSLLPFAGVARIWTEGARGLLCRENPGMFERVKPLQPDHRKKFAVRVSFVVAKLLI